MSRFVSNKLIALLAAVVMCIGCGASKTPQRNSVSGLVTLSGRPIENGIVTLHGADGSQATGSILPGGRYLIDDPPLGVCQVTVAGPPGFASATASGVGDPHAPPPEAKSNIPKKYATPGNGLTVDVKPGQTPFDIRMEP